MICDWVGMGCLREEGAVLGKCYLVIWGGLCLRKYVQICSGNGVKGKGWMSGEGLE